MCEASNIPKIKAHHQTDHIASAACAQTHKNTRSPHSGPRSWPLTQTQGTIRPPCRVKCTERKANKQQVTSCGSKATHMRKVRNSNIVQVLGEATATGRAPQKTGNGGAVFLHRPPGGEAEQQKTSKLVSHVLLSYYRSLHPIPWKKMNEFTRLSQGDMKRKWKKRVTHRIPCFIHIQLCKPCQETIM